MRPLIILSILFSSALSSLSASAANEFHFGFDSDREKIEVVHRTTEEELLHLRDRYLAKPGVTAVDLEHALQNLYKICGINDAGTTDSHKLSPIRESAQEFWQEAIAFLRRKYAPTSCRALYFSSLLPDWGEVTWGEMRERIEFQLSESEPYSVPGWSYVLVAIASRPNPARSPIPEDIAAHIRDFMNQRARGLGLVGPEDAPIKTSELEPMFYDMATSASFATRILTPDAAEIQEHNDLMAFAPLQPQSFLSAIEPTSGMGLIISGTRGVALAYEALRPGSLTIDNLSLGRGLLFPEDLEFIRESRMLDADYYEPIRAPVVKTVVPESLVAPEGDCEAGLHTR